MTKWSETITEVDGRHIEDYDNIDVTSLLINRPISFRTIPLNIGNYFPKLTKLVITESNLSNLTRSGLSQFKELAILHIEKSDIQLLEAGLFADNEKIVQIKILDSKIAHVHENTFKYSEELELIEFDNLCATINYQNVESKERFNNFVENLVVECTVSKHFYCQFETSTEGSYTCRIESSNEDLVYDLDEDIEISGKFN